MSLFKFLRNKYFLITVAFVVWVIFYAQYDIISQWRQHKELQDMREKIEFLSKEVERLKEEAKKIETDPETIEKYAREKHLMKKSNEEVFLIDSVESP